MKLATVSNMSCFDIFLAKGSGDFERLLPPNRSKIFFGSSSNMTWQDIENLVHPEKIKVSYPFKRIVFFCSSCTLSKKVSQTQIFNRGRYSFSNINQQLTISQQTLKTWCINLFLFCNVM